MAKTQAFFDGIGFAQTSYVSVASPIQIGIHNQLVGHLTQAARATRMPLAELSLRSAGALVVRVRVAVRGAGASSVRVAWSDPLLDSVADSNASTPVRVRDVTEASEPVDASVRKWMNEQNVRSLIGVPVRPRQEVLGIASVCDYAPRDFELAALSAMGCTAVAIERAIAQGST